MQNFSLVKHLNIIFVFSCLIGLVACGSPSNMVSTPTPTPTPTTDIILAPMPTSVPPPTPTATPTPFKVITIDITVSPTTIAGLRCGAPFTVTYTATFHIAPHGPGGTIQFAYTVNNGRGQTADSLTLAPGETMKNFSFVWLGKLPVDHTYPEQGGVITSSPNQVISPLVGPTGQCN